MRLSSIACTALAFALAGAAHAQSATDRDGDGVPDATDPCPGESEDGNGFEDTDDCPDEPRKQQTAADRAAANAREAAEGQRLVDACFASAKEREKSAHGGYSIIDAWRRVHQRASPGRG